MRCQFKRSDMTPCYIDDGALALCEWLGKPDALCVGCERTKEYLDRVLTEAISLRPIGRPRVS